MYNMTLKVYNTLFGEKEEFKPWKAPKVNMYVCGPTVYSSGHVGHARTYIAFDIIRRYLEYKGFKVRLVMNITDVHDSIFEKMKEEDLSLKSLTDKYTKQFLREIKLLGIKKAYYYPRVTEHIKEIIDFIQDLIKKGFAYQKHGSVYFDVSKFKDYGKLSGIKIEEAKTGTRVETDKYEKREVVDFALWKAKKPGEPSWKSPWGEGRPGWHIECSVMSQKYLGNKLDLHGGAKDLIFPHHENEIAQSEAKTGLKPFVKYWVHSGLLTIEGEKMSKSLGNYIEIGEALKKWSPRVLRLLVASSHYSSALDWSKENLLQAKRNIEKIDEFVDRIRELKNYKDKRFAKALVLRTQKEFEKAMDDDFNTPRALATLFHLINRGNFLIDKGKINQEDVRDILGILRKMDQVFNFIFWKRKKKEIPEKILKLAQKREKLRNQEKFEKADKIRKKIEKMGYRIEDTEKGFLVKF